MRHLVAQSLRDQLVAAGLASSSQAKKADKQKKAEALARKQRAAGGKNAGNKGGQKNRNKNGNKNRNKNGKDAGKPGSNPSAADQQQATQEEDTPSARRAKLIRANKARRDKELARERNERAQAKAIRAEIKQLVTQHDQRQKANAETDVAYNFLHKKKIKRLYVPAEQKEALSKGKLMIVNNDGLYHLVAPEIAAKIAKRDPKWIITAHDEKSAEPDMDDYYKKFEVPDDLDW